MPADPATIPIRTATGARVDLVRNPDPAKGGKQDETNDLLAEVLASQEAILGALSLVQAGVDLIAPATALQPVAPSDATVLTGVRAIYVGTGGNLVLTIGGQDVTLNNIADGTLLPVKGVTKVKLVTTASNIVAFK
jgi:hypothetical protein